MTPESIFLSSNITGIHEMICEPLHQQLRGLRLMAKHKTLNRLQTWIAKSFGGLRILARPAQSTGPPNESGSNPLAELLHVVQDAQAVVEQQLAAARLTDDLLAAIERQLGLAWSEREKLTGDYYALLRSVITVWEDCGSSSDAGPELQVVRTGLEKALRQQGVEVTPVAAGDVFDPDTQSCEEVEPSAECAPGTVLRVLETGYRRWLGDGSLVIVRPAKVVIGQTSEKLQESRE